MNKIMKMVKDQFFILALLATFIGFSAFKAVEGNQLRQSNWYQVSISSGNPEDPSNQNIGGVISPPTGNCQTTRDSVMCAIELSLNPEVDPPSTVEEAIELEDLGQLLILDEAHSLFKSGN